MFGSWTLASQSVSGFANRAALLRILRWLELMLWNWKHALIVAASSCVHYGRVVASENHIIGLNLGTLIFFVLLRLKKRAYWLRWIRQTLFVFSRNRQGTARLLSLTDISSYLVDSVCVQPTDGQLLNWYHCSLFHIDRQNLRLQVGSDYGLLLLLLIDNHRRLNGWVLFWLLIGAAQGPLRWLWRSLNCFLTWLARPGVPSPDCGALLRNHFRLRTILD